MQTTKSIKFLLSIASALVIALIAMYLSTDVASAQVNGEIKRVWIDHNVYEDSQKGMRIHVQFTARNMRGAQGRLVAYFKYQNGVALNDHNGRYRTSLGKVSVGRNFTPRYANSVYKDFKLFMPYAELHMADGYHRLEFDVAAFHTLGSGYTQYARSNGHRFTYDKGPKRPAGPAPNNTCHDAVQGKIAWDYQGSTTWNETNVARLCRGNERSTQPARCFARVMHGGINWGGGTRWQWENAVDLCEGTYNANTTISCFQSAIGRGRSWPSAIRICDR